MSKYKVKTYAWLSTTVNYETVQYFYICDSMDRNGNTVWRVFIIDPDGLVYETKFKCYVSQIEEKVISFCERGKL